MSESGDSSMMEDRVPPEESDAGVKGEAEVSGLDREAAGDGAGDGVVEEGISSAPSESPGEDAAQEEREQMPEPAPERYEPEAEAYEPEAEAPKEPSRVSRFLRTSLRWVTALVLIFALGVLATWLTRVRPQAQALRELRVERDSILARAEEIDEELLAAQEQIRLLQSEVDELEGQLQQAQGERAAAQNHLDLLQVLVDISAAQLAVAQEEPLQARAALESTDERLASLQGKIPGDPGEQIGDLRDRLALALESIGEDDFAAQRDLEVLANSLLAIERLAFDD